MHGCGPLPHMTGATPRRIDDVTGLNHFTLEQGMELTLVSTRNNALIGVAPL
ncbi:hypothetical protein [Pseudomonas sp. NPDC099000]|uniref:hypothetical protein n=1 Tax=Pseudomonas sp. NPDC099000 TaxID=3364488 RepID=UPI00383BC9B6